MFFRRKKGQSFTEFVLLLPLMGFFLLAATQISLIAIKAQKLEMAGYYAARLYAKEVRRGIRVGTVMQLHDKRQSVIEKRIQPKVRQYLNTDDVTIKREKGNKLVLTWPIQLSFGVGRFSYTHDITLTTDAEFESDPLEYGGGEAFETYVE